MTTLELMYMLESQYDGYNQDGPDGLLTFADRVQNVLCKVKCEQFILFGSTGQLPPLPTQARVYEYYLSSNAWLCDKVLVERGVSGTVLDTIVGNDYGQRMSVRKQIERVNIAGIDYYRVPYIRTYQATETTNPKVVFTVDPGDTTTKYRTLSYRKPTPLLSTSIPLTMPEPYDMKYLLPGVQALIEAQRNGNPIQAILYIENELKPAFAREMNQGEQGFDNEPEDRGF